MDMIIRAELLIREKKDSTMHAMEERDRQRNKSDIRSRLGTRQNIDQGSEENAKTKLDNVLYDEEKVLDRDELERLRFANAVTFKPWETNPEMVPRGNYFEVCFF